MITGKSTESKGLAVGRLEMGGAIVANEDGDTVVGDGAGDEDDDDDDDVEEEDDETVDITSDVSVDDNFDSLAGNDVIFELAAVVVATKSAASVEEAVGLAFDICCSWIFLFLSLFFLSL